MLFGRTAGVSWILVFLGNPGEKYETTRHNMGFRVADRLAKLHGFRIDRLRFHAKTCLVDLGGQRVLLLKPQTFMNASGDAVQQAMSFYKVPTDHILVVSDDVSLKPGQLRLRRSGSAGGHNGLKDIIAKCGGEGFPRVRLGVGSPTHPEFEMIDWVLGTPAGDDAKAVEAAVDRAAEAIPFLLEKGVDAAMNRFNSNQ